MRSLLKAFTKYNQDEKIHTQRRRWQIVLDIYSYSAQNVITATDETAELSNISHQGNISIISR